MGRNKNKQRFDEDRVKMLKNEQFDEDIPDEVHNRLLESIKQFHGKPKIVPATRNEPAAEVSEFNLTATKKKGKSQGFREKDLLQAIKKKQPKIARKLQFVKKPQTLPKPLESVHEKKAQREVGFDNVRKKLSRWNDVVTNNRLADQLKFPLKNDKIQVHDHTTCDLFSSLPNPTPLEKELAEVLNSSQTAKKHEEKLGKSRFRLTLKEMIEKRTMFSKVKAQASYKIAKAWRQNKIKSKKYHRILRREKTKQQVKDFESLQKTDPDAALKQLKLLEKSRAEERATLRHRNTGKWAKNQIIRATYNKESRIALSEQLQKNRELTQKNHVEESDSESDAAEGNFTVSTSKDPNNPWVADTGEYAQFVTGYKKFWEEKSEKEKQDGEKFEDNFIQHENTEENANFDKSVQDNFIQHENTEENANFDKSVQDNEPTSTNNEKNCKKRSKSKKNKESAKKMKTVAEIVNSSGSWMVTEDETEQTEKGKPLSGEIKPSQSKNKSSMKSDNFGKRSNKKVHFDTKDNVTKHQPMTDEDFVELRSELGVDESIRVELKKIDSHENIDPNKYLKVTAKRLVTEIPEIITGGDEGIDDGDGDIQRRMTISEAFADDDVIAGFEEEKQQVIDESQPKEVNLSLPGWGSWTSGTIQDRESKKPKRKKINKRLLFRIPKAPPRKDANKGHVIINEIKNDKMRDHMVSELPFPFTSVKDYEASIRAPVGRTWLPETAHQKLIAPPVVTKLGTVIEPMDEGELLNREEFGDA